MLTKVVKFGGSSLADAEQFKKVAAIIKADPARRYVVPSAPGKRHKTTNRLEGKGFHWVDDRGVELLTFYPSVIYSSFVEISNPRGGITICCPSDFIKVNDNLFIYSRIECEFSGTMVLEVIDLYGVKQIGVRLGFDENDELDYVMYRAKGDITQKKSAETKATPADLPTEIVDEIPEESVNEEEK